MSAPRTPRTRRGADAVEAAIEAFEVSLRIDEVDASMSGAGHVDLGWVRHRIDAARRAADADVVSADEALDWLATTVGREVDLGPLDDEADGGAQ